MDIETAKIVFVAIATPLIIIWTVGVRYSLRHTSGDDHTIKGELEVKCESEALSKAIATGLLSPSIMGRHNNISTMKIVERTSELVTFERAGASGGQMPFDSGAIMIDAQGDTCKVRYAISVAKTAHTLKLLTYILIVGLCGLVVFGVGIGIWLGIVTNANLKDAHRLQTYQTFQMIHGAWPPYLMGFIASRLNRGVKTYFDTLISNAVHVS